jgi:uncharacterized protein YxjI
MRYVMKQKLWSLGNTFIINDDSNEDRFQVKGRLFSFGDNLSFQDMQGNELAAIHQKLLSFGNTYEIYHGGELFAVVSESLFRLFNYHFTVDVGADGPGPGDLEINGDFFAHEYTFSEAGQPVAGVSRAWFSWADTYGVDIASGQDDVLILACTVVVDMCTEKHKHRS